MSTDTAASRVNLYLDPETQRKMRVLLPHGTRSAIIRLLIELVSALVKQHGQSQVLGALMSGKVKMTIEE